MRRLLLVLLALIALLTPTRAADPPAIINWLEPQSWLTEQHPPRANARLVLVVTLNGWDDTRIYLASDWAAVQRPNRAITVYDYRLGAVASSGSHAEMRGYPLGPEPLWRLDQLRSAADVASTNEGACAAGTRFGVELPDRPFRGSTRLEREGKSMAVICGDRVVSSLEVSEDTTVPATLWPTLANELKIHPRLAGEMASLKLAPQTINTLKDDGELYEAFSLDGAWPVSEPYPLGHFVASPHWTFVDDDVETLVTEFVAGKVAGPEASAGPPADRFSGFLGEQQLLAEELPKLIDGVRAAPNSPARWMDLSDYYVVHDDPFAALALVGLAYNLPGGPEDVRVNLWLARLQEVETIAPQFFLRD